MLHCMQQPAQTRPSPTSSSFAGLLAVLASPSCDAMDCAPASTTPVTKDPSPPGFATPASSESDLGEDVETLSYERALRAHARYKPVDRGDWNLAQRTRPGPGDAQGTPPLPAAPGGEGLPVEASAAPQAVVDGDLRQASVTIRLSKAECARLRQRAAEAGVTVSAYLRSCTFEAEALRAHVKEALAELRSAGVRGTEGPKDQGNKGPKQCGSEGIRLVRVLAHIGNFCIGLSSGKSC